MSASKGLSSYLENLSSHIPTIPPPLTRQASMQLVSYVIYLYDYSFMLLGGYT